MAKQIQVPDPPKLFTEKLKGFTGVDFANNPTQVVEYRSPDAQNMISDLAGMPVKRPGYETLATFDSRINGIFRLVTDDTEKILVHAGTKLYEWVHDGDVFATSGAILYSNMNDVRSTAFQNNGKLFILDGKTYLCYGEFDGAFAVKKVSDIATVPTCVLARRPNGVGGTVFEDVNVLTPKRTYSFTVLTEDAEVKEFHLTPDDSLPITSGTTVKVRVMNASADWDEKKSGTDFTVNYAKGIITFTTAPGANISTGVDKVEITFEAKSDYEADLINKCSIATMFGYNGATDRVFVSGNPESRNFHYWSEINDPCYFPGLNYAYLGQDSSAIIGYSHLGNSLAVHKEDNEQDQTIFLVTGNYSETNGYNFAVSGSIAGIGAISKHCFRYFGTEPMFLSKRGVYAITTQYMTVEKYAQNRSYYVDPRLIKEPNLEEAVAIEYNGYYYLGVNSHVYVADSRGKVYEKNAPQSEFQYEWYYLTNIDARVWWVFDNKLYFGTPDGKIKRFFKPEEFELPHKAYNDDGEPIHAYWDTPVYSFNTLYRNKTLKNLHIMPAPGGRASMEIYYKLKGDRKSVATRTFDIFDFRDIDFTRFTFVTDDSPVVIATNAKAKKFMLIQFRMENKELNESFGFYEIEANYIVVGKYKG